MSFGTNVAKLTVNSAQITNHVSITCQHIYRSDVSHSNH